MRGGKRENEKTKAEGKRQKKMNPESYTGNLKVYGRRGREEKKRWGKRETFLENKSKKDRTSKR